MFKNIFVNTLLTTSILLLASSSTLAADKENSIISAPPAQSYDGLQKVNSSVEGRMVFMNPDADFSIYKNIQILKAYVAFKKNWRKLYDKENRNTLGRISDAEITKVKERVSSEFDKVFKKVFNENGYPVVDKAEENTLLIRPALVSLNLASTGYEPASNSRSFNRIDDSVTLYIELYDAITGDILARVAENREINNKHEFVGTQNHARNNADMARLLTGWAEELRKYLDSTHKNTSLKGK